MAQNNGKGIKIVLFVLPLIAIGVIIYLLPKKADVVENADTQTTTPEVSTPEVKPQITTTAVKKTIKEETSAYTIDVTYPVVVGLPDKKVLASVNADLLAFTNNLVAQFKKDNSTPSESDGKSGLVALYKLYTPAHGIQSVSFDVSDYSAGAAHPNSYISTKNYEIETGNVLALTDLCEASSTCLASIAKQAKIHLKEVLKSKQAPYDSWAEDGSSADELNYQVFVVTPTTLDIIFNPYQVAAYALGPVRVPIPFSELSGVIKAAYK
jgi:hypothetical protein